MNSLEALSGLVAFALTFLLIMLAEIFLPRREVTDSRNRRWFDNLSLFLLNTIVIRGLAFLLPVVPAYFALYFAGSGAGFLYILPIPFAVQVVIAVIFIDFVMYIQHCLFHALPSLWQFHLVHHSDLDIDLTTGLRFHPLETLITLPLKLAAIYVSGAPFVAVVVYEILLISSLMFIHSNIKLLPVFDRILKFVFVTPEMHIIHHSVIINETNSNFGNLFSWWDYIFGTYAKKPLAGFEKIQTGLAQLRKPSSFTNLITMPFTLSGGAYSLRRFDDIIQNSKGRR